MRVIVDHREAQSGVADYLKEMKDASITFQRLSAGDYLVDNQVLFERKTVHDFAQSVVDGRLFNQARRLSASSYKTAYILEGTVGHLKGLNVRREALQGAMVCLTVLFGIPLLRSFGPEETARLISYASIQLHRLTRGTVHRPGYRPKEKRKRQLYILQGLPGIGPVRAEQLLDTFGSVRAVFCALPEELSSVSGVGGKMAEKIHLMVN